jgi:hypothetical protein
LGENYKISQNLLSLLLLLPLLLVATMQSEQQKVLAQPLTTQNGQQPEANHETVVTANLKNSSSLSLFSFRPNLSVIPSNLLENPDILIVDGYLTTSSLFGMEMTSSPPNQLNFTFEPIPYAEIQIIVEDETYHTTTIINATSVKTDESGYFWTSVYAPHPRVLLVIAYFEGNENSFPTYDAEYLCETC